MWYEVENYQHLSLETHPLMPCSVLQVSGIIYKLELDILVMYLKRLYDIPDAKKIKVALNRCPGSIAGRIFSSSQNNAGIGIFA